MRKVWRLWPKDYIYSFYNVMWGIGFDLFIAAFIIKNMNESTKFYINDKEVTFAGFLLPVCAILMVGLIISAISLIRNVKVSRLRKELVLLKSNFQCYEGTISGIERLQVNDRVPTQAGNIHNRYTHSVYKVNVDYIDEDGRARIATSEEYSENLFVFLKDTKAKVYVSKNGNNRIVDDLSWRQSFKDEYIDIPNEETKAWFPRSYYQLLRWKDKIAIGTMLIAYLVILILILR